jgi:hypothetical protein
LVSFSLLIGLAISTINMLQRYLRILVTSTSVTLVTPKATPPPVTVPAESVVPPLAMVLELQGVILKSKLAEMYYLPLTEH